MEDLLFGSGLIGIIIIGIVLKLFKKAVGCAIVLAVLVVLGILALSGEFAGIFGMLMS